MLTTYTMDLFTNYHGRKSMDRIDGGYQCKWTREQIQMEVFVVDCNQIRIKSFSDLNVEYNWYVTLTLQADVDQVRSTLGTFNLRLYQGSDLIVPVVASLPRDIPAIHIILHLHFNYKEELALPDFHTRRSEAAEDSTERVVHQSIVYVNDPYLRLFINPDSPLWTVGANWTNHFASLSQFKTFMYMLYPCNVKLNPPIIEQLGNTAITLRVPSLARRIHDFILSHQHGDVSWKLLKADQSGNEETIAVLATKYPHESMQLINEHIRTKMSDKGYNLLVDCLIMIPMESESLDVKPFPPVNFCNRPDNLADFVSLRIYGEFDEFFAPKELMGMYGFGLHEAFPYCFGVDLKAVDELRNQPTIHYLENVSTPAVDAFLQFIHPFQRPIPDKLIAEVLWIASALNMTAASKAIEDFLIDRTDVAVYDDANISRTADRVIEGLLLAEKFKLTNFQQKLTNEVKNIHLVRELVGNEKWNEMSDMMQAEVKRSGFIRKSELIINLNETNLLPRIQIGGSMNFSCHPQIAGE